MADAPSPSPYAPGIISDERLPPRPAGRASVFLVATFAMTIVTSGLYRFWSGRAALMTGHENSITLAMILTSLPGALVLLWAYLSDRVGLLGARREGFLLLACVMMGMVWIALAFGGQNHLVWMATALPTGLAAAVSRAAIVGALAEIGQRRAATGRLAAAEIALADLAEVAALLPATFFVFVSIAWTAGVAVGLMVALGLLIAVTWDAGPPAPALVPPIAISLPRFLRSRPFWTSVAVLACAGAATVPDTVVALQMHAAGEDRTALLAGQWKMEAIIIGAAVLYLLVCRHIRFDLLLRFALIAKGGGLVVHALAARATDHSMPDIALLARSVGDGLASAALLDLALRAAPRGREAFGAVLLAGLPSMLIILLGAAEVAFQLTVVRAAWFGAGAALAAMLAVWLLPPEIGRAREGRRVPEGPMLGSPP